MYYYYYYLATNVIGQGEAIAQPVAPAELANGVGGTDHNNQPAPPVE